MKLVSFFCGQIDNDHLHRVKCKFLLSYQPLHWLMPCISYLHGRLTGCIKKKKQCIVARESSCDSKYTTLSYKCIRISSTVCATKSCCFKKAIILFNISGSFKVADGWLLLSVHFLVVSRSSPLSIYKWNASKMIAHILFLWFQLQT